MASSRTFRIRLETPEGPRDVSCGEEEFIWDAAERQGLTLPAICHQGRCLTCAGRLLEGDVEQSAADAIYPADIEARYVLLCRARPRGDSRIRTHMENEMRAHRLALGLPAPYA